MKQPKLPVPSSDTPPPCCPTGSCGEMDRRSFVQLSGISLAALGVGAAMAGPFTPEDTEDHFIPTDKKLAAEWVAGLFQRGESTWYSGDDLKTIGMPVGGVCAGQVYLTGEGQLVYWGIFNQNINSGFGQVNYKEGRRPTEMVVDVTKFVEAPRIEQGFAIRVATADKTETRSLDQSGFPAVRFCGEYPIGRVEYRADDFPVEVALEAFSPFIPLQEEDSAIPVTLLHYRLENRSPSPVEVTLAGLLQNGVLHYSEERCQMSHVRRNDLQAGDGVTSIRLGVRAKGATEAAEREPIVFADFEGENYGEWTVEGEAFGAGPAAGTLERQNRVSGYRGRGLVNTFFGGSDRPRGKLTSPTFQIERPYISFLVGGGSDATTAMRLVIDGQVVRQASGKQSEQLLPHNWNVREFIGKSARLEIVDDASGPWGHINIDQIELRDSPMVDQTRKLDELPDLGTMALSVCGDDEALVSVSVPSHLGLSDIFSDSQLASDGVAEKPMDQPHRCALGRTVRLAAGEARTLTFLVSWHMPNLFFGDQRVENQYARRFTDAVDVARYVAANESRLSETTRLWHDTYYDSTLPYWLLDRLHSTVANLATETCQWWGNGRFWAYEGCGCCHGTCGHVWNYEHAMARLFPRLERSVREMQDFAPGVGFIPETGEIRFRGENWDIWAGDSQGGYVLKAYREHQISRDSDFLKRNWPRIRRAVEFLIEQDGDADGLIEGRQHQTYDQDYYGANTMVGSLYLGALRAAEEMALEMGDAPFARTCRQIFEAGRENSVRRLFNGEYFIQEVDLTRHPDWQYADGCLADQLFGQGWAHQVNLGYVYPRETVLATLRSIWKYCWAPDVALQNARHEPQRWFAFPGEGGLFTCTWPKSQHLGPKSTCYRDEIWTGIEYQVANHMAYEGMLTETLVMCRAVHDRYHPRKRNPFNEIECGDHYARALASWGVLLGLAGFTYHGPRRELGFAPRLTPERFRSVFTTSDAWGTYDQGREGSRQTHTIAVQWGELHVRRLILEPPADAQPTQVVVSGPTGSGVMECTIERREGKLLVEFSSEQVIPAGTALRVELTN